ncbi:MAG: agmatinase [Deltaproteobacteria bacterium]|nr:agmatinase [Deltaproteobacteria bacterium]MBW2068390.1 agmatinase [Deltaproteobacteria bacterium]
MAVVNDQLEGIPLDWGSPYSFYGLKNDPESWEKARAVIIPVPYDGTTTYVSGTREGPRAVILASRELEPYDEETGTEPWKFGIFTLEELPVVVSSPEEMVALVKDVSLRVIQSGKIPVLLGGEHLMSLGVIQAIGSGYGKEEVTILHFDAHADLRDEYQSSRYSNACVMRRALEFFPVVSIGVRSLTREEHEFAIGNSDVNIFFAQNIWESPKILDEAIKLLNPHVYVTIDLDVLDPSIMPAVGTPEPGGITWYQLLKILRHTSETRKIIGFDVMELRPIPGNVAPDFTAARLIYKMLAYVFSSPFYGE